MIHVKPETRLIGFDDGPFTFEDETTPLAGVMTRAPSYVEGVFLGEVAVDGWDATEALVGLVEGTGFLETAKAIALNGGTLGGFNVVDLQALHEATGVPVVAVLREPPDAQAVEDALAGHFEDAEDRLALLRAQPVEQVALETGPLHLRRAGGDLEELALLLGHHTVRGRTPEPVRIAHLVATAAVEGVSRGA